MPLAPKPGYRRDPRDLRSPPEKLDDAGLEAALGHARQQLLPVVRALRDEENELRSLQARVRHQEQAVRSRQAERDFLRGREEDVLLEQWRRKEEESDVGEEAP